MAADSQVGTGHIGDLPQPARDIIDNKLTDPERDFLFGSNANPDPNRVISVSRFGDANDSSTAVLVQSFNPAGGTVQPGEFSGGLNYGGENRAQIIPFQNDSTVGRVPDANITLNVNLPAHVQMQFFGPGQDQNASGQTGYINHFLDSIIGEGAFRDSLHNMVYNAVKNSDGSSAVRVVLPTDDSNGLANVVLAGSPDQNETILVYMSPIDPTNTLVARNVDTLMLVGNGSVRISNDASQPSAGHTPGVIHGTAVSGDLFNQTITGSDGNDTIIGGGGTDYLKGGAGADRFSFALTGGHTVITDFNLAEGDKIALNRDIIDKIISGEFDVNVSDNSIGGFHISDVNVNGTHLILVGVKPEDITQDMMSFDL